MGVPKTFSEKPSQLVVPVDWRWSAVYQTALLPADRSIVVAMSETIFWNDCVVAGITLMLWYLGLPLNDTYKNKTKTENVRTIHSFLKRWPF